MLQKYLLVIWKVVWESTILIFVLNLFLLIFLVSIGEKTIKLKILSIEVVQLKVSFECDYMII